MQPPEDFASDRLWLRPPRMEDAKAIFDGYAQDQEVARYMTWRPHRSPADTEAFLAASMEARRAGRAFLFALILRDSDQLIGMLEMRPAGHRAEIGYVLARPFWGQGLGSEAARTIVDWAIGQPEIFRVWAVCDVENRASARVLEKVGMQREGLLRRWIIHPNISSEPRDAWCYALVK